MSKIIDLMDYCDEKGGVVGPLTFITIGTIACCTGVAIPILIADAIWDADNPTDTMPPREIDEGAEAMGLFLICGVVLSILIVVCLLEFFPTGQ